MGEAQDSDRDQDFSSIAAPLTALTRKEVPFIWDRDCEVSFNELQGHLISAPVLTLTSRNGSFTVYSDASGVGLGWVVF